MPDGGVRLAAIVVAVRRFVGLAERNSVGVAHRRIILLWRGAITSPRSLPFGGMWKFRGRLARATFAADSRSEEHTSELQSLMRISYAVFCLKKKKQTNTETLKSKKEN